MRQFDIEIGETEFCGQTASAQQQFEALHIVGRTGMLGLIKEGVQPHSLAVMLLKIPLDDVRRLRDLLLKDKVVRSHDKVPVGENLFADQIHNYYMLLGRVIVENLQGFSELRHQMDAQGAEPTR